MKIRTLIASTMLVVPLGAAAQVEPLGTEFQVNTFTAVGESYQAVAAAPGGSVMVVWQSARDGDGAVFGQFFDSAGQAVGTEFQVNTHTVGGQGTAAVAAGGNGTFVVAWSSFNQDGDQYGVFAQRYDSDGQPMGAEFQANSYTVGSQSFPPDGGATVAAGADGAFVIAWAAENQDGSDAAVVTQRFDSAGQKAGTEFQANTYTLDSQYNPSIAAAPGGAFVLVWAGRIQDGDDHGVFGQRFDGAGQKVGTEFQANSFTTGLQTFPAVAVGADGAFFVAWSSDNQDGSDWGAFGQRYSSGGQKAGAEFQINTFTPNGQSYGPAVAARAGGSFVVVWGGDLQDGDGSGVFGREFDSAGQGSTEFPVNTYTTDGQVLPVVASAADGSFVVSWTSYAHQGSFIAQRFEGSVGCGNGMPDGGEECDDGNLEDGDGCDSNCTTTACGNGITTSGEACDDGNTNNGDGCSSICEDTAAPENEADPELTAGETLTSDTELDGATPEDPVETSITLPAGTAAAVGTASATIAELSGPAPSVPGYSFFGQQVQIDFTCSSPCPTASNPLTLAFRIDASRIPAGVDENSFAVLRDGVAVGPCTGSPGVASPDPCVDERELFGDGDIGVTILTSLASEWTFAEATCSATPLPCGIPGKAIFSVKQTIGDPSKTKLIWKWLKGTIAEQADFGDPLTGTGFTLCVYDGAALVESHSVEGGGDCDGDPCWKPVGTSGFKYKNPAGNDSGITKVLLKSGSGKAKILVKGKGEKILLPASDPIYAQSPDVTVQMVSSAGGCWQAVYPTDATVSSGEQFKDKFP